MKELFNLISTGERNRCYVTGAATDTFYPLKQSVKESVGEDRPTLRTHGQPRNTLKATRWIKDKFGREKDLSRGRPIATHSRGVGRDFSLKRKTEVRRKGGQRLRSEEGGEGDFFFLPLQLDLFPSPCLLLCVCGRV